MVNYLRYSSPVVYTRAHFPYLLDEDDWRGLLQADSVERVLHRLEATSYGAEIGASDPDTFDLEAIETAIFSHQAEAARAPMLFLSGKPSHLLQWHWRMFEIDNLKVILRGVDQNASPDAIKRSLIALPSPTAIDWQSLAERSSIQQVVDELADSPYASMLAPAMKQYREERDRFYLEIALDLGYNRRLMHAVKALRWRDRTEAERFIGNLIDSRLIIWSFRFRVFGQLEPEQIINFTLDEGFKVTSDHIRRIALGADLIQILKAIWGESLYEGFDLEGMSQQRAISELEVIFLRHRYQQAVNVRRKPSFHLGLLLAYEILLEAEALDLITLLEGVASGWPLDRIRPHLIAERGSRV